MIMLAMVFLLLFTPAVHAAENLSDFAYDQRIGNSLPLSASFLDQDGHAETLGQALGGRPAIVALGYFHCRNLCGLVRDDLFNAISRLEGHKDFSLTVISIDPSETPDDARQALASDQARFNVPATYLTGQASSINAVAEAVGFRSRFDAASKQFLHPSGIVFTTRAGTISSYLLGVGYQPRDVQLALTRASNGATAKALPVLLLCFHYDPTTGRYTLATMRLLQLGAVITLVVLGGTIAMALRRQSQ